MHTLIPGAHLVTRHAYRPLFQNFPYRDLVVLAIAGDGHLNMRPLGYERL